MLLCRFLNPSLEIYATQLPPSLSYVPSRPLSSVCSLVCLWSVVLHVFVCVFRLKFGGNHHDRSHFPLPHVTWAPVSRYGICCLEFKAKIDYRVVGWESFARDSPHCTPKTICRVVWCLLQLQLLFARPALYDCVPFQSLRFQFVSKARPVLYREAEEIAGICAALERWNHQSEHG